MPQLHPNVEELLHSGKYLCRPRVEGFTEHETKDERGNPVKVTRATLEKIAKVNNEKAEQGSFSLIGPGHTFDDQYENGKLTRKFPEHLQPIPFGKMYNYRVELNPSTGKYSLFHDEYIDRLIQHPETGEMMNGLKYSATFPRRSAEIYHALNWIDWMAAIRRAPKLDLALTMDAQIGRAHV